MVSQMEARQRRVSTTSLPPPSSDDIRKVAVKREGNIPILCELDQKKPLEEIIVEICQKWSIQNAKQYGLQYSDTLFYITQENRGDIRDGAILTLSLAPEHLAAKYMQTLQSSNVDERREAFQKLAGPLDNQGFPGQAEDPTFAKEFIRRKGMDVLVIIFESGSDNIELLTYALAAFQELMEHGLIPWDNIVTAKFVKKVASYVQKGSNSEPKIVQRALSLLDNIVVNSTDLHAVVSTEVAIENLLFHMQSSNQDIQLSAIALCNSMLLKVSANERKILSDRLKAKKIKEILATKIIQNPNLLLKGEIAHQLYVYQSLILGMHGERMNIAIPDVNDPILHEQLMTLYNAAFESSPSNKGSNTALKPDFSRLGFENTQTPLSDFTECPPGVLSFDVMLYFAKRHQDQYVKIILENFGRDKEYECPFGKCTNTLVKMMCEILKIGEPISDTSEIFFPMFFATDFLFEELYCVCIQLLNKTWKEMRATNRDYERVISVVREQIVRMINERPDTIEKFKAMVFGLSYQQIMKVMQQEFQERNLLDLKSAPVKELREEIEPQIVKLVKQQRLAQLVEGQAFKKVLSRRSPKDKFWYCRLSPNHRFLHYGDVEESAAPPLEALANKLPISEVKDILVGKNSPIFKDGRGRKGAAQLAFSLLYDQDEHMDFIAPNQKIFSVWTDGLRCLLGKEMCSPEAQEDLETLLNMEMKLLLLDVENIPIADAPPSIPQEPENLDFYYKYD